CQAPADSLGPPRGFPAAASAVPHPGHTASALLDARAVTAAGQLCTPSPSLSGAFAAIVRGPRRGARCHALPVLYLRESCRFTVLRPVRCAARPRSGACAGPARVHPAPSGREDPLPP